MMRHPIFKLIFTISAAIVMVFTLFANERANAGTDPYLGELSYVAFGYAPRGWKSCDGQLVSISQNQALFSLIGTTYGGDGTTNFALPDMRGRVPIHQGRGPGLSLYSRGYRGGIEITALEIAHMPTHTHSATAQSNSQSVASGGGAGVVNGTLKGSPNAADTDSPNGKTLAQSYFGTGLTKTAVNTYNSEPPSVALALGSVSLDLSSISLGNITTTTTTDVSLGDTGSGNPFSIVQPYVVVNCIIAMEGAYPPRN